MESCFVGDTKDFVSSDIAILFVQQRRPPLDGDGGERVHPDGQRLRRTRGYVLHRHDTDGVAQFTHHGVVKRLRQSERRCVLFHVCQLFLSSRTRPPINLSQRNHR